MELFNVWNDNTKKIRQNFKKHNKILVIIFILYIYIYIYIFLGTCLWQTWKILNTQKFYKDNKFSMCVRILNIYYYYYYINNII